MKKYIATLTFLLLSIAMFGQNDFLNKEIVEEQDTIPPSIIVEQADNQILDATTQDTILYLNGNVRMYHDSTYMYCDTAQMVGNNVNAFGDIAIVRNEKTKIFSDSLYYLGDSLKAYFYRDVVLDDGKNQLFTKSLVYNFRRDYGIYTDTALLRSENYEIKSKRGIYFAKAKYVDFTENVSVESEDTDILTDSLRFYTEAKKLVFKSPTRINQGDRKIYGQTGYYYLDSKDAFFEGNAQLVTPEESITSHQIYYYGADGSAKFIGNAQILTGEDIGTADSIFYNKKEKVLILKGNAEYITPTQTVKGKEIRYSTETKAVQVYDNGYLSYPPLLIWSGDINYDKENKLLKLKENVIVKDTSSGYTLHGDFVNYDENTEDVIAYNLEGKPWVESVSEKDTLYMSGDTLRYINIRRKAKNDSLKTDTIKYFKAYANVEFLNKDVAGIADTLTYNRTDSLMFLRGEAMMWRDSTQLTAEEIDVKMVDDAPEHITLRKNAVIMNTADMVFFNQMKGDRSEVYLKSGELDRIDLFGNVNTVYYITEDDGSYIGVDQSSASKLVITIKDKKISFIKYYKDVKSEILPIEGTDHQSIRVQRADWRFETKPETKEDLWD